MQEAGRRPPSLVPQPVAAVADERMTEPCRSSGEEPPAREGSWPAVPDPQFARAVADHLASMTLDELTLQLTAYEVAWRAVDGELRRRGAISSPPPG